MYTPGQTLVTFSLMLPPSPPRRKRVATMALRAVILPPRIEECDDAADVQTLPSQLGHERACDYCACAPEVTP